MKERFVIDLKGGEEVVDFFMIKSISIKVGANGKEYLDFVLSDASGDVSAKKWDVDAGNREALEALRTGQIVKVKGQVTDWKGQTQLRVTRIRPAAESDELQKVDFIKAAPEDPQAMYDFIMEQFDAFEDEDLKKLCRKLYTDNRKRLLYWPAAMANHHAEYGGLLYHVKRMMMTGKKMCEVYTNLSRDLLLTGIAIHDIEKLNEIDSDENGVSPGYSFEGQMLGHLVQGVRLISEVCRELGIGEEKAVMLEHMILSHHYEPEFGSPKRPLFPEAEMLHYIDVIDAKMFDMEDSLRGVEPGSFGDRVWTLDNRRLYRRTF